jgi:hypothetical protein
LHVDVWLADLAFEKERKKKFFASFVKSTRLGSQHIWSFSGLEIPQACISKDFLFNAVK